MSFFLAAETNDSVVASMFCCCNVLATDELLTMIEEAESSEVVRDIIAHSSLYRKHSPAHYLDENKFTATIQWKSKKEAMDCMSPADILFFISFDGSVKVYKNRKLVEFIDYSETSCFD